jgi:hypothetical protein
MIEFFAGDTEGRIVIDIDESWVSGQEPTEINVDLSGVVSSDGEVMIGSSSSVTILASSGE